MTVKELKEILDKYILMGHANTDIIANCKFEIDGVLYEKPLIYFNKIYYQSGDIELEFSDKEE